MFLSSVHVRALLNLSPPIPINTDSQRLWLLPFPYARMLAKLQEKETH